MLTGVKDTEILILNNLNDKDLLNYCEVNQEARRLCQSDNLWINRIVSKFPELKQIGNVKEVRDKYGPGINYKDYYIDLANNTNDKIDADQVLIDASQNGRLDVVIILLTRRKANIHANDGYALR